MQDIVYKLVPNLERPKDSQSDATNNQGGTVSNSETKSKTSDGSNRLKPIDTNGQHKQGKAPVAHDFHCEDEQINLCVIPHASAEMKPLKYKYLRLSSLATVTHLKKFVALKLYNDMERYREIDLLCNDNLLGKDHNFKFISVTEWREKVPPVKITYRPRVED